MSEYRIISNGYYFIVQKQVKKWFGRGHKWLVINIWDKPTIFSGDAMEWTQKKYAQDEIKRLKRVDESNKNGWEIVG